MELKFIKIPVYPAAQAQYHKLCKKFQWLLNWYARMLYTTVIKQAMNSRWISEVLQFTCKPANLLNFLFAFPKIAFVVLIE